MHIFEEIMSPGGVVHDVVDGAVDGMDNEGDDTQTNRSGGPLPGRLRHSGNGLGHAGQWEGTDAVYCES